MGLADKVKALFRKGKCKDAVLLSHHHCYICIARKTDCRHYAGKKPAYVQGSNNGVFGVTKYLVCPHYTVDKKG